MTEEMITTLEKEACFPKGKGRPLCGETVPKPEKNEAIIFKDFFSCGLRFPSIYFLRIVLETFKVQLHHLTPNGILTLSKFCYACETCGVPPDLDTFCTYYELQQQPKKVKSGEIELEAQFGSYTFMAKRLQKDGGMEISFAQRTKWEKDWTWYWFYMKTTGVTPKTGPKVTRYPFASTMGVMRPSTHVKPPVEVDTAREVCDAAFAKACRYFGGRDLVEEMVASKF